MQAYKCLKKQVYSADGYSIVPIRNEDRLLIMKWRNEQIYHLRQNKPLTEDDQNNYFDNVVGSLFEQEEPNQILFSYMHGNTCIGYGGLVHISWKDRNAEVSFIMNTELEKKDFHSHWTRYLRLIEQVSFNELNLHKIYTYAFDLRPHLYKALESSGFLREAILKEHSIINGAYYDVIIHCKLNSLNE